MNDNSSRFGKFLELVFSEEGLILGGKNLLSMKPEANLQTEEFMWCINAQPRHCHTLYLILFFCFYRPLTYIPNVVQYMYLVNKCLSGEWR